MPAPSRFQSSISPQLDAIVLRALSIREIERYQTARELSSAIETFLARSADTVPIVDLIEWLGALFPGAEAEADAIQRKVLESAPAAAEAERPRFVPVLPAVSIARAKSSHVVSDEELWPMGDSSPPSRAGGSVDAVLRQAEAAPAPIIIPSEEQPTKNYNLKAIRAALSEPAESAAPAERQSSKLGSTLFLTILALIIGIVAGLIALRHRFVDPAPPPAPSVLGVFFSPQTRLERRRVASHQPMASSARLIALTSNCSSMRFS